MMLPSATEPRYSSAPSRKLRISSSARAVRKKPDSAGGSFASRAAAAAGATGGLAENAYSAVASSVKLCTRCVIESPITSQMIDRQCWIWRGCWSNRVV